MKRLPVERISATNVAGEIQEGLWSTNIHETFMLAGGVKAGIYDLTQTPWHNCPSVGAGWCPPRATRTFGKFLAKWVLITILR
jgi:hypothetical protein